MKATLLILLICVLQLYNACFGATFTVTNSNDSGSGSFRAALQSANTAPGSPHSVIFNIPATDPGYSSARGVWKISLNTPLPYITGSNITIDATSQTTFGGNTNPYGPEIELDGNHTLDYGFFIINGANITLKGFIIRRFTYGIQISGSSSQNHTISGNYIGVNHDASDTSGCFIGIEILNLAGNVTIGGINEADRNIVSGNYHIGIRLLSSSNNILYNNYIGVDRTGNIALPNYDGLSLEAVTQNNIIGGASPGMKNVISGNYAYGLPLIGLHTQNNIIRGNFLGTNASGTAAIPNTYGILFDDGSRYNIIGGYNTGEGNLLSGNTGYGVFIYNLGTTENKVYGNLIGTDVSGTYAIPNGNGIVIDGVATKHLIDRNVISGNIQQGIVIHISGSNEHIITRNYIGTDVTGNSPLPNGSDGIRIAEGGQYNIIGVAPDSGNVIAYNGGNGVMIMTAADYCNRISGNSIYNNALLGIDLWPAGVTSNDAGDTDSGPNKNMNFPVIQTATYNSLTGETTVTGVLDTQNPQTCAIDFFLSDNDITGYGEGKVYIGSATPLSNGTFSHVFPAPFIINSICATATDECGNTSEFSANFLLPPPNTISELSGQTHISLFPNPVSDVLNILFDGTQNEILSIINAEGKILFECELQQGHNLISLNGFADGVYFAKTKSASLRFVKTH